MIFLISALSQNFWESGLKEIMIFVPLSKSGLSTLEMEKVPEPSDTQLYASFYPCGLLITSTRSPTIKLE